MHLTLGMGIFWLLLASTVSETIVRAAKALGARRAGEKPDATLAAKVANLEQQLLEQAERLHAQEDTVARIEESTQFVERLVRDRSEGRTLPRANG